MMRTVSKKLSPHLFPTPPHLQVGVGFLKDGVWGGRESMREVHTHVKQPSRQNDAAVSNAHHFTSRTPTAGCNNNKEKSADKRHQSRTSTMSPNQVIVPSTPPRSLNWFTVRPRMCKAYSSTKYIGTCDVSKSWCAFSHASKLLPSTSCKAMQGRRTDVGMSGPTGETSEVAQPNHAAALSETHSLQP